MMLEDMNGLKVPLLGQSSVSADDMPLALSLGVAYYLQPHEIAGLRMVCSNALPERYHSLAVLFSATQALRESVHRYSSRLDASSRSAFLLGVLIVASVYLVCTESSSSGVRVGAIMGGVLLIRLIKQCEIFSCDHVILDQGRQRPSSLLTMGILNEFHEAGYRGGMKGDLVFSFRQLDDVLIACVDACVKSSQFETTQEDLHFFREWVLDNMREVPSRSLDDIPALEKRLKCRLLRRLSGIRSCSFASAWVEKRFDELVSSQQERVGLSLGMLGV